MTAGGIIALIKALGSGSGGGGGGSALVVNITFDEHDVGTCDKTADEMWVAFPNFVVVESYGEESFTKYVPISAGKNSVSGYFFSFYGLTDLKATSGTDYPHTEEIQ